MKNLILVFLVFFSFCTSKDNSLSLRDNNVKTAKLWVEYLLSNPNEAKKITHNDFTWMWMGNIEMAGKLYTKETFFTEYIGFIAELVPGNFDIKILDYIADDSGVALRMKGDGEGRYGDYDNDYLFYFRIKDDKVFSIREYTSDILVATQLYNYKITPPQN